jgi:hypothetical protein
MKPTVGCSTGQREIGVVEMRFSRGIAKRFCAGVWLTAAIAITGCATQEAKRDAINDINFAFKAEYETILARSGTRMVNARADETFDATTAALVSLGMEIRQESRGLGFINADAAAPLPLSRSEWDRASAVDLPRARELLRRHVGLLAELFSFEPEGLDTVITATIIEARGGSEVSVTMRMREVAPPKSGLPRREYPPPTALQAGIDKIWSALEREQRAKARRSDGVGDPSVVTTAR